MKKTFIITTVFLLALTACGQEQTPSESIQDQSFEANEGLLDVHFIDVGQGDASLVTWEHEEETFSLLVDAGDWNDRTAVDYLHEQGIEELDLLIGTHPHADHIGQMADVINEFHVAEAWMSGDETDTLVFERTLDAILENDVDYHEPRAGEEFDLGGATIEVLHPESVSGDLNNGSIVMKLTYGQISFLFTGDVEHQAEQDMLERGANLEATVLSVPHHGSNTSSSDAFIEAVQPTYAIYSAGLENAYNHPADDVLQSYESIGATIYGTDENGTIIASTNGQEVKITTNQNQAENHTSCINVNTATAEELEGISEIGPDRAQQIIELRPFSSVNELTRIDGIGEARLNTIKEEGIACVGE
ncbi:MBL fold metallo-hydrolase [Bacillus sp. Marseille-P3800]|uniref:MBL fold metallo-hydrolase n=1 Tax=Bacillus sp. Marseille-P3800 TaxID=2014782 RepID=UPI000C06B908|nr:MBL fold metallo-hydrolase [Bacillus sp. Marseille-P3800]